MFSGIIECTGTIVEIRREKQVTFRVKSPISTQLKVGQSVAHDGACLTVVSVKDGVHEVNLSEETLLKTHFQWKRVGDVLNLERALKPDSLLDGHLVFGHVDTTAVCIERKEASHSTRFRFALPQASPFLVEKGAIAVNGISLTPFDVTEKEFTVAIIPYTLSHTNLSSLQPEDRVNIEFDIIGKYVHRLFQMYYRKQD
jgi:riboflavin synthase